MFILLEERLSTQIKDIKSTKYSNQSSGHAWNKQNILTSTNKKLHISIEMIANSIYNHTIWIGLYETQKRLKEVPEHWEVIESLEATLGTHNGYRWGERELSKANVNRNNDKIVFSKAN